MNVSLTFIRQIVAAFAQLMSIILIARAMGPEGNGLYTMTLLLPVTLATFLNIGVTPASVYFVSRGELSAENVLKCNLKLAVMISVFGMLMAIPIILLWGDYIFPNTPRHYLFIGLSIFPLSIFIAFSNAILQGLESFKAFNWTVLTPPIVTLILVFISVTLLDLGIVSALIAYLIGQIIGALLVYGFVRPLLKSKREHHSEYSISHTRKILSFGWKAHLANIMAFLNYRSDIFLVNFFLTPVATGIYVIAVQMAEKLWLVSQAASTILLPRLSAMGSKPSQRYELTMRASLLVGIITALGALILTGLLFLLLVPVFGESYNGTIVPYLWLTPGIVAGAISRVQSNCIAAVGRPEWNFYSAIVVVFLNITGNILLIPIYGLSGAAIATSFAYLVNAVIKIWLVRLTLTKPS